MLRPVMHVWSKTVTTLTAETLLELFQQALDLRPPNPAPASGERRDPPEAATLGSFRMPLADGHSRGRRCVACWHVRV